MSTKIRPSEATIQAMTVSGLNLITQALSIYDDDLRLVHANERFREMFGIPEHLMRPGASFEETLTVIAERGEYGASEDVGKLVQERVQRALAFEPHYLERERTDGRWISVEGTPLPQGGWVAVYTDITATKRQEALLRARSEELSEQLLKYSEDLAQANRKMQSTVIALEEAKRQVTDSEARMRLTAEMMPAHIAHLGPDERYTYSNRRLSAVLPGRPQNIVGRQIAATLGTSTYEKMRPKLREAFGGTPSVFEFTDAESQRRIRVALTPDDETDEARGVYILSMNVTEETQTRAALQQTRRRELAAQMTSGLAHDFSNLLTIILGMQSKLEKIELPREAQELVEVTLSAAHRGGALLNRLADMTAHRAPKLSPVLISDILSELNTLARPAVPENITLTIRNSIENKAVLLDAGMLQDSLLNLLLNARDACGEKGEIFVSVDTVQDTWLRYQVRDTGDGFSDEALAKAFDPFFTTKGNDGSGLGLPMVYDTTKLMGGDVRIGNNTDGATVTVRLPLRWAQYGSGTGLVLLVEDNVELRGVVRGMLTNRNHTVIEASSVAEAITLIDDLPEISMILSDVKLEGSETGVDLARELGPKRPVFLMTSLPATDPLYVQGAALAPILSKPFSADALFSFLNTEVS